MKHKQLNIGIVAHVDAGKTSLTERLLHATGVIDRVGSVDGGDTQTDSLDLERRRGITIQSAVVSFRIGDVQVNLIDTPGHSDFIAEVARAVHVLDGAILVVSAVEGVQAQTRVLMRTLRRLRIPTIVFANKIDRSGARYGTLLAELRAKLTPHVVALSEVDGIGTRGALVRPRSLAGQDAYAELAEAFGDEEFLAAYVEGAPMPVRERRAAVERRARRGRVFPVYFGSAVTGEGVADLIAGIRRHLPYARTKGDRPRGSVFKIERGPSGEKIAYVRLRGGTLRAPGRVELYRADAGGGFVSSREAKATAVRVFTSGAATEPGELPAGGIAKVWGLRDALIGDAIGSPEELPPRGLFAPPTLETAVKPVRPQDRGALWAALRDLSERDPLIGVRGEEEAVVSLYGEVQKEVIASVLGEQFGIAVTFEETRTVHVERVIGTAEAHRALGEPYPIYVSLRIEPGEPGGGVAYRVESQRGSLLVGFHKAIEESVYETLRTGPHGWQVVDCVVALTKGGYVTGKTAGQFRELVPLMLHEMLLAARTRVCMPVHRFELEVPEASVPAVVMLLTEFGATVYAQERRGGTVHLGGTIEAGSLHGFERRLPGITSGEALLQTRPDGYRPVTGPPPVRPGSAWAAAV